MSLPGGNPGAPVTVFSGMDSKPFQKRVSLSSFEYLLREIMLYKAPLRSSNKKVDDEGDSDIKTGAVHNAETEVVESYQRIEKMGYEVGYRYIERALMNEKFLGFEDLDCIKFICKDFWEETFQKKVDKLQTNHKGVFVLFDNTFKWLEKYASEEEDVKVAAAKLLHFPCGLIRGALANMGILAIVNADFVSLPAVKFNITVKTAAGATK